MIKSTNYYVTVCIILSIYVYVSSVAGQICSNKNWLKITRCLHREFIY